MRVNIRMSGMWTTVPTVRICDCSCCDCEPSGCPSSNELTDSGVRFRSQYVRKIAQSSAPVPNATDIQKNKARKCTHLHRPAALPS